MSHLDETGLTSEVAVALLVLVYRLDVGQHSAAVTVVTRVAGLPGSHHQLNDVVLVQHTLQARPLSTKLLSTQGQLTYRQNT